MAAPGRAAAIVSALLIAAPACLSVNRGVLPMLRASLLWLAMLSWALQASALTVHVKPGGDNAASGDEQHPLASVAIAVARVQAANEPGKIIIHGGRYFERVDLNNGAAAGDAVAPLEMRAAEGEQVILDGSRLLSDAAPLAEYPGVYTVKGDFRNWVTPQVWEPASRRRYIEVADLAAVVATPGSVTLLDEQTAALRTSDGAAPARHEARISQNLFGVFSTRDNLTLRGIRTENHLGWSWAAGITIQHGRNVLVEDCTAVHAVRGFVAFSGSVGARFVRCRTQDVGGGIYSGGRDVAIEHCLLDKTRDRFMIPIAAQDDSGIQYYSPAVSGAIRHNVVRGFRNGIYLKASGGYVVEHNTVIDAAVATFNNTWMDGRSPTVMRYNIFSGSSTPLLYPPQQPLPAGSLWDDNLCWSSDIAGLTAGLAATRGNGQAAGAVVGDPLFVDAGAGDYRLRPESPAALGKGAPWGALPVAGSTPPTTLMPPVQQVHDPAVEPLVIDALTGSLGPAPPRVLHVAMNGCDGAEGGSVDHPLATIGAALQRARPGDTVRVAPGFYVAQPLIIRRSGAARLPITIEAAAPNTVTLDGLHRVDSIFTVEQASHLVIRNLNIRWFNRSGIVIRNGSAITVTGCRIQRDSWAAGFVDGAAVHVERSPDCVFTHNIMCRTGTGLFLNHSPGAVVEHNSASALDYGGLWLIQSCRNTRVRNNAFCFAGNDSLLVEESSVEAFRSLEMDYNNWAAAALRAAQPLALPLPYLAAGKAVITVRVDGYPSDVPLQAESRLLTLTDWQRYSGQDAHSIFADPRWIDPRAGVWELHADSPNLGAGKDGATIGATGVR
jgi:hypothetical protein